MNRHETILHKEDALLVVVDYQQKIVDVMQHKENVTPEILRIVRGLKRLDVPMILTEQYPKGLGPTVPEIRQEFPPEAIVEKITFSCCGSADFHKQIRQHRRRQIIVVGVETHVCVLQTVLDLLANSHQVHLPISATCSRSDLNRDNAFSRMQQAGAILTNTESLLFELLVQAGTDEFKAIQKLIV